MGMDRVNRIEVPAEYEVMDADALASYLGFKKPTVLSYMSRENWKKIPKPNRQLRSGHIWYVGAVKEWQRRESDT